jgi:ubiquinone/menaquinone biosynthesis C-methylase UbiE
MALTNDIADAYSSTASAWERGPAQVYGQLAAALLDDCPGGVAGRRVLDLGAGTGALGRAANAAGAREVVAADVAIGMLRSIPNGLRAAPVVGDACHLPFVAGSFDVVGAAFALNHVEEPAAALVEARRVLAAGGALIVSAYASDDDHPVKSAVAVAAAALGWQPEPWYEAVRTRAVPRLATEAGASTAAAAAGLTGAITRHRRVTITGLGPADLVAWRLGMAQLAPWVERLDETRRGQLVEDALDRLGSDPPPLVRSMITLAWWNRSN